MLTGSPAWNTNDDGVFDMRVRLITVAVATSSDGALVRL
jgi:hypothetical protein